MARFTIYSKDGQIKRHEGEPQYSGSYMGVDFVEFRTISSPTPIDWQIGDYVDYYRTGKRYRLYYLPMPKKVARKGEYGASFEYSNVQLYGATKELEIAPFRDLVPKDNKIHFSTRPDVSTYENVYGVARRIQECMDDLYPNKWRIEVYDTDDNDLRSLFEETKEYSVSGGSCLDALSQIYETWKNVGWIHTYDSANKVDVITIGRANVRNADNTSDSFAYGVGKGLTSIKKASANKDEFATRLYIYGSERNIQTRYYNGLPIHNAESVDIRNLMIPASEWGKTNGLPDASKAFIQADDATIEKYGLIPRTIYFDGNGNEEIYPSIVGLTMSDVRSAMIDAGQGDSEYLPTAHTHRIDKIEESFSASFDNGNKENTEKNPTFELSIWQLGFNIAEHGKETSAGYATISMKSGPCAGREFKIRKNTGIIRTNADGSKALVYQIEKYWDESLGMGFPNTTYPINDGDEFVLLDIPMPEYYITLAERRLLDAGRKMLADYTRVSAFYEPSVDAIKIKEGGKLLQAGMFMQVYDEDIIDTADKKDYVLIDTLTIDEKSDLPIYRVTLREQKRSARTYSALEDMIEDARESSKQEISRVKQYTDRRFRSAQETLDMLAGVFENFTDGISPATVRTMAMLVGDESLQFKFTASRNSLTDIPCPLSYNESTKQMNGLSSALIHMTLGIEVVTTGNARNALDYNSWNILSWNSAVLEDTDARYVYVKASKNNTSAEYILSKTSVKMEEVNGYYHFLVGILNSEINGKRDFVTLYGFTEVLPGQITTDVIKSANSNLIIDLANAKIEAKNGAEIKGKITFTSGSSGLNELTEWQAMLQDGAISPLEKQTIENEIAHITAEKNDIDKDCESYDLVNGTVHSSYTSAWEDYKDVLDYILTELKNGKTVEPLTLTGRRNIYYAARTTVLEAISNAIKGMYTYINNDVIELNKRLDGVVVQHSGKEVPTFDNKPCIDWTLDKEKINHIGDIYTNISDIDEDSENAGKSWRWCSIPREDLDDKQYIIARDEQGTVYYLHWHEIADSDAAKALEEAAKAKDMADGKRKVFVSQPTASEAYDVGDLWVGATYGTQYSNDILRAKTSKKSGDTFNINHWTLASKYTDDTKADEALGLIEEVSEFAKALNDDTKFTEVEKRDIRKLMAQITECQTSSPLKENAIISQTNQDSYAWYLVNDRSYAEFEVEENGEYITKKVSQRDWVGYYSSNMHDDSESTKRRLDISVYAPFELKIGYGSDAEGSYDYLSIGNLNNASSYKVSTSGRQKQKLSTSFNIDKYQDSHFIDIQYRKDGSQYSGTDSGYYRIQNNGYYDSSDNFYVVELKGSFHKQYLTLKQNGYNTEAEALYDKLNAVTSFLFENGLWDTDESTVNSDFRSDLLTKLNDYYSYATEVGFGLTMAKIDDASYLSNAIKNGKTIAEGGVVLSSIVAVADTSSADDTKVEAFLNGSDFGRDTDNGKLILAGGIPRTIQYEEDGETITSTDLEDRAKEANTRIYEDGRIVSNDLHLKEGCTIGDLDILIEKEFIGDNPDDERYIEHGVLQAGEHKNDLENYTKCVRVSHDGLEIQGRTFRNKNEKILIGDQCSGNYAMSVDIDGAKTCHEYDKDVGIHIDTPNAYSILSLSGLFAGLRPNIRTITASSSDQQKRLSDIDHTILIESSTAITVTLPSEPPLGQEYVFMMTNQESTTVKHTIKGNGYNVYDVIGNNKQSSLPISAYGMVKLVFAQGASERRWYFYRIR